MYFLNPFLGLILGFQTNSLVIVLSINFLRVPSGPVIHLSTLFTFIFQNLKIINLKLYWNIEKSSFLNIKT